MKKKILLGMAIFSLMSINAFSNDVQKINKNKGVEIKKELNVVKEDGIIMVKKRQ